MPGLQRPTDAGDSVGSPMDCDGAVKTLLVLLLVFQMGPNHFLYLGFLYFYNIFLVKKFLKSSSHKMPQNMESVWKVTIKE